MQRKEEGWFSTGTHATHGRRDGSIWLWYCAVTTRSCGSAWRRGEI